MLHTVVVNATCNEIGARVVQVWLAQFWAVCCIADAKVDARAVVLLEGSTACIAGCVAADSYDVARAFVLSMYREYAARESCCGIFPLVGSPATIPPKVYPRYTQKVSWASWPLGPTCDGVCIIQQEPSTQMSG